MSAPRRRCVGVILAGGGATRYGGRPKGLERIGGSRIIDRVARALASVTDELLLIANDPSAPTWLPGVRTLPDLRAGEGALGGVHAALAHAGSDIVLVAWDMPFVPAVLLEELRRRGEAGDADAVLPSSDGSRRGVEPLCAWYGAACLPAVAAALDAGDRRVIAFHDAVRVARMPVEEVQRYGDPTLLFANVNTPQELARWSPTPPAAPPLLAIVGKKHAGKTTLTVQLAAELTRRGHRIMTLKHGSHTFNLDPAATDTYRHYHEGNAERVAMASPDKFALVTRWDHELAPEVIAARYLGEAELVLCEGFKASALPKVEIHRLAAHATSLLADAPLNAASWRAMVTDAPTADASIPAFEGARFTLGSDGWLDSLADWVEREYLFPSP